MLRILFKFCLLLFFQTYSNAQVSMTIHQPPAGIVAKDQLWNITLINTSQFSQTVIVSIELFDQNEARQVLTVTSKPITLNKGVKILRALDMGPLEYTYFSSVFTSPQIPSGLLPIGNYRACYNILTDPKSPQAVLAEECISIEVTPLSPPNLVTPIDTAVIESIHPQFVWLPPMPSMLFADLNYNLVVTEVQPGQSPLSAIQENLPTLQINRITNTLLNFPASNKSLEPGKTYAWRVISQNATNFSLQSEVWTFRIAPKSLPQSKPNTTVFIELKERGQNNNVSNLMDDTLEISYYSYEKGRDVSFKFKDQAGLLIFEVSKNIQYGSNRMSFKLNGKFKNDSIYSIEMEDLQGTAYSANFKTKK